MSDADAMTVQELLDELKGVEDKDRPVFTFRSEAGDRIRAVKEVDSTLSDRLDLNVATINQDPLPMDEPNEQYGYGVYNVHKNCFCDIGSHLEGGSMIADDNLAPGEDEVIEAYEAITEGMNDASHLRVVQVQLDNEVDMKAAESTDASSDTESSNMGM